MVWVFSQKFNVNEYISAPEIKLDFTAVFRILIHLKDYLYHRDLF